MDTGLKSILDTQAITPNCYSIADIINQSQHSTAKIKHLSHPNLLELAQNYLTFQALTRSCRINGYCYDSGFLCRKEKATIIQVHNTFSKDSVFETSFKKKKSLIFGWNERLLQTMHAMHSWVWKWRDREGFKPQTFAQGHS